MVKEERLDSIRELLDVLFRYGLCLLAASLPLILWHLTTGLASAQMNEAEKTAEMLSLQQFSALLDIFCYLLLGVGMAGCARVLRQLVWGEPIFFFYHFKIGIRQN